MTGVTRDDCETIEVESRGKTTEQPQKKKKRKSIDAADEGTHTHIVVLAFSVKNMWWKSGFKQVCYELFFTTGGYSFRRFYCNRDLIPDGWRSYRESKLASVELRFRNKMITGLWLSRFHEGEDSV